MKWISRYRRASNDRITECVGFLRNNVTCRRARSYTWVSFRCATAQRAPLSRHTRTRVNWMSTQGGRRTPSSKQNTPTKKQKSRPAVVSPGISKPSSSSSYRPPSTQPSTQNQIRYNNSGPPSRQGCECVDCHLKRLLLACTNSRALPLLLPPRRPGIYAHRRIVPRLNNELSLDIDEDVTDIKYVGNGWSEGAAKLGLRGRFPTYVVAQLEELHQEVEARNPYAEYECVLVSSLMAVRFIFFLCIVVANNQVCNEATQERGWLSV